MLHEALRYVRKFHGMSVNDAAAAMDMSPSHVSELERGKKRIHSDVLEAYSKTFDLPISAFFLIAESRQADGRTRAGAVKRKLTDIMAWIAED